MQSNIGNRRPCTNYGAFAPMRSATSTDAPTCWRSCSRAATPPPRMRRETDLGKLTCLVLEGEDMTFILTIVDKAALAHTIIKPAPVRQPQRQGDLLGARRDVISETPPDPEDARTNSPLFAHAMPSGSDLGSAKMAQGLNLERELYGPVSKFQILCFQSFDQVPALAHFSTVGIGSRAGRAGPRKLVNRSGFLLIK
jgi:hypothetical protein